MHPEPPTGTLSAAAADLRRTWRGQVFLPGGLGFDERRRVWNGMVDRTPALSRDTVTWKCTGHRAQQDNRRNTPSGI